MMTTAQTVNVEEHLRQTNQENTGRVPSVKLTVAGAGGSAQPYLIKGWLEVVVADGRVAETQLYFCRLPIPSGVQRGRHGPR